MAQQLVHSVQSSTLADVLERVLDKGIVIAGDIKIKLVEIELLTIQIRLMIASVDKAKEIGMDWWEKNPEFNSSVRQAEKDKDLEDLKAKVALLERGWRENLALPRPVARRRKTVRKTAKAAATTHQGGAGEPSGS